MAAWNFDGDFYYDEEPVYRGISLATVPLPFSDPLMDLGKVPPMPKLMPAKMPTAPAWPTTLTAPAPAKADGAATVQAGGTPESLRERLVELLREEGEVVVVRKEKPGVWKAKVQLFSDERHEALTLGVRVTAGAAPHWSTAELRRYRGDAVLFAAVLQRARAVLEGAPSVPAPPAVPAVGPEDVVALLQLAEVCPEDAVAQLARVLDRLDDQAVQDLQVDVAAWLASSEVGVVGAACAVASRIQAPVRSLALHEAVARLQNADTLAGRLLMRLVLALPADSQATECKGALLKAGCGLDAETHRYIAEICAC